MSYRTLERIRELPSILKLEDRSSTILNVLSEALSVQALLYKFDNDNKTINLIKGAGKGWEDAPKRYPMEGSIPGLCIECNETLNIRVEDNGLWGGIRDKGLSGFNRAIYMPLKGDRDERSWGLLCLKRDIDKEFNSNEKKIIDILSLYIKDSLVFSSRIASCQRGVEELMLFYEISRAILSTIDLERLIYIILVAITVGDGLGFNRAIFFLVNEKEGTLDGMMGIGPNSAKEASRIWNESRMADLSFRKLIAAESERPPQELGKVDKLVKLLRLSLDKDTILTRTVKERRPFNIIDAKNSSYDCHDIIDILGGNAFASLPLISSNKVVGVLVVDNLYSRKPITEESIDTLMTFCRLAGLAIENSLLYSRLKREHEQLLEMQTRMIHNEKMIALGEMAATLSHEIRNPLLLIGGFANRLKKELDRGLQEKHLDRIESAVKRLERILDDVLEFSRKKKPKLEEYDMESIILEALDYYDEKFKKAGIKVVKEIASYLPKVLVDRYQMIQVLINLFTNAQQAMMEGGILKIRLSPTDEKDRQWVVIEVEDTGGGIPADVMGNIFDPFFTTKEYGTGLGLSIVHNIITNHKGTINVKNLSGKGVIFTIKLPGI